MRRDTPISDQNLKRQGRAIELLAGKSGALILLVTVGLPSQLLWLSDELHLADKFGLEAVIVALVLGLPALMSAIEHANTLKAVARDLQEVADTVPTRSVGIYPDYLSEIAQLVGRASESIKILCDTPGYGMFSNSRGFLEYLTALRRKIDDPGVTVECRFLDSAEREQLHTAQIAPFSNRWREWQELNRDKCIAFAELTRRLRGTPPTDADTTSPWAITQDEYVAWLMKVNEILLEHQLHGADRLDRLTVLDENRNVDALRQGPSVYVWIRDTQEAVFVMVPLRGAGVRDLAGFSTRQPELIRALTQVFARYDGHP